MKLSFRREASAWWVLYIGLGYAGACSSGPHEHVASGLGSGSNSGDGSQPSATCSASPLPPPTTTQRFDSLSGTLVDELGAIASDAPVTVCSFELCISGAVSSSGSVTVQNAQASQAITGPALKVGDGIAYAELAYPLPNQPTIDAGTTVAVRLPPMAEGVPLVPGTTATSAGLTLIVPDADEMTFDEITYPVGNRGFRATPIPLASPPLAVDPAVGLEIVFGVAPQGTTFCPAASLELANTLGWAPGTPVDVLVHGVDLAQEWAPYGGWAVVANGSVSSDGTRISTAPGQGLPVLSAVGIRRSQ